MFHIKSLLTSLFKFNYLLITFIYFFLFLKDIASAELFCNEKCLKMICTRFDNKNWLLTHEMAENGIHFTHCSISDSPKCAVICQVYAVCPAPPGAVHGGSVSIVPAYL